MRAMTTLEQLINYSPEHRENWRQEQLSKSANAVKRAQEGEKTLSTFDGEANGRITSGPAISKL